MSKYERTKLWVKKNREPIAAVVIVLGFVGIMIAAVKADLYYQEQQEIHLNAYIDEMNAWWHANGIPDTVLFTPSGDLYDCSRID